MSQISGWSCVRCDSDARVDYAPPAPAKAIQGSTKKNQYLPSTASSSLNTILSCLQIPAAYTLYYGGGGSRF